MSLHGPLARAHHTAVAPLVAAAFALLWTVACVPKPPASLAPTPPEAVPIPPESPSADSRAIRAYYGQVQQAMLQNGLLRTERAPRDAPFDANTLVKSFLHIALHEEYSRENGRFVRREAAAALRRWEQPVLVELRFGASVSKAQQTRDTAGVRAYLARLAAATAHPIHLVETGGNFPVFIVSEDERRALAPALLAQVPRASPSDLAEITDLQRDTYCVAYALSQGRSGRYRQALAIVRAEHPDLLREACLHEEIAQGLGLSNDSPHARPSIFNDDEEFAFLTQHDEWLLKMLYDPRLRPGMTATEATPILHIIARELIPDPLAPSPAIDSI